MLKAYWAKRDLDNLVDPLIPLRQLFHECLHALLESADSSWGATADVCFNGSIDVLIRIAFGTLGRRKKQLNAVFVLENPAHY